MFFEKVFHLEKYSALSKRIKGVCRGDVSGRWRCKARWQTLLTSSTSLLLLLLNLIGCQSEMELQEKLKARKKNLPGGGTFFDEAKK